MKLPCKHMMAIVTNMPHYSYKWLGLKYLNSPVFTMDVDIVPNYCVEEVPSSDDLPLPLVSQLHASTDSMCTPCASTQAVQSQNSKANDLACIKNGKNVFPI